MKNISKIIKNSLITNKIKWIILLVFALITLLVSWSSDDAYHAYIMAKNLADGNGLVYNAGYRVTASTCPLFTILTAGVYILLGYKYMYFAGILLGVVCSTLAVYILIFKVCKSDLISMMSVSILLGCYCFMSYTTAGLENSLLFLLSAAFMVQFISGGGRFERKRVVDIGSNHVIIGYDENGFRFVVCSCYMRRISLFFKSSFG